MRFSMKHVHLLSIIIHWMVSGVAVMLTAYLIRGFQVSGFVSALIAAVVIGIANAILWPALMLLTLPINILTLGFFTFVVNGALLKICAWVVPGFEVKTWGAAIFGSMILSLVSAVLHYILV